MFFVLPQDSWQISTSLRSTTACWPREGRTVRSNCGPFQRAESAGVWPHPPPHSLIWRYDRNTFLFKNFRVIYQNFVDNQQNFLTASCFYRQRLRLFCSIQQQIMWGNKGLMWVLKGLNISLSVSLCRQILGVSTGATVKVWDMEHTAEKYGEQRVNHGPCDQLRNHVTVTCSVGRTWGDSSKLLLAWRWLPAGLHLQGQQLPTKFDTLASVFLAKVYDLNEVNFFHHAWSFSMYILKYSTNNLL